MHNRKRYKNTFSISQLTLSNAAEFTVKIVSMELMIFFGVKISLWFCDFSNVSHSLFVQRLLWLKPGSLLHTMETIAI